MAAVKVATDRPACAIRPHVLLTMDLALEVSAGAAGVTPDRAILAPATRAGCPLVLVPALEGETRET